MYTHRRLKVVSRLAIAPPAVVLLVSTVLLNEIYHFPILREEITGFLHDIKGVPLEM